MARTSSIIVPSMVGIVGHTPAVDDITGCFFFLISLSRFRIMEFVKTETLSASSAIFKTVMVPLHR